MINAMIDRFYEDGFIVKTYTSVSSICLLRRMNAAFGFIRNIILTSRCCIADLRSWKLFYVSTMTLSTSWVPGNWVAHWVCSTFPAIRICVPKNKHVSLSVSEPGDDSKWERVDRRI